MLKIDNTKRSCFVRCPRKYYYEYVLDLQPAYGSTALRYGSTWHAGMDGFYSHIKEHGWTRDGQAMHAAVTAMQEKWSEINQKQVFYDDYRTLENCIQSLIAYMNTYAADEGMIQVLQPEAPFAILMNEKCEGWDLVDGVQPFIFTGQIDCRIKLDTRPWTIEHKTTGQAITIQAQRLQRTAQFKGYTYADTVLNGKETEGMLVSIHHLSSRKSPKTGLYGKVRREFERIPQIFSPLDIFYWKQSFMNAARNIQRAHAENFFPMEDDACYMYGKCSFANLCEQNRPQGEQNLDGYVKRDEPWDPTNEETKIVQGI